VSDPQAPPIRIAIVDDEPLARERIRRLLAGHDDVEVVAECGDGGTAGREIVDRRPDLVFLDVQMPVMDGLDVADELLVALGGEAVPLIVFTTAYEQYAIRAFEAHAMDYLVKPFSDERFAGTLANARRRLRQMRVERLSDQLRQLLGESGGPRSELPPASETASPTSEHGRLDRLVLRTGPRSRIVRAAAVDWIGADGVYARVHVSGRSYLIRTPMHELESRLDPQLFVRIHRSSLVNLDRIQDIHEVTPGEFVVRLADETRLKVSRSRRLQLEAALGHRL